MHFQRFPGSVPVVASALGLILLIPIRTFALELGEASIKSALGESLLVEIPYRLAANEQLTSACVGLVPASRSVDVLPTYARVSRISVSSTHIEIFDDHSVREPLIGLNVDIHCNTAPHFARSYQLFVDPPARVQLANGTEVANDRKPDAAATGDPTPNAAITRTARAGASPRARGHAGGNLTQGQTYRVVRGDTLSGIAARIAGRPATIGQTADAIFAANPKAFTRGNPDLIEEGRSITIPYMPPATVTPRAASTPAPLNAVEAELPTAASAPNANLAPAPTSATQPLHAEDVASVVAPVAIEPLAATATVEPSTAPVATATPADLAPDAPSRTTPSQTTMGRSSALLTAVLALGVVILFSAPLAFVRRRKPQTAARTDGKIQKSRPGRTVDTVAGITVVESRPDHDPEPSDDKRASISGSKVDPAADLNALALTIGPTDSVDLDVGTPIVMNERVDWFAERADAAPSDAAAVGDPTIEENAATTRLPDLDTAVIVHQQSRQAEAARSKQSIDDADMTLTIVELDMLRQDYETEHTLTQASQALRDAVADLKATQAALAATAETSTMELPQELQSEMAESAATSPTARIRMTGRS